MADRQLVDAELDLRAAEEDVNEAYAHGSPAEQAAAQDRWREAQRRVLASATHESVVTTRTH